MKRILDLGGTVFELEPNTTAVNISLDGTSIDDGEWPRIVGDYNKMPFPPNTFDAAWGGCYLEEPTDIKELLRVLKPGAKINVSQCGACSLETWQQLERDLVAAGLELVTPGAYYQDDPNDPDDFYIDGNIELRRP